MEACPSEQMETEGCADRDGQSDGESMNIIAGGDVQSSPVPRQFPLHPAREGERSANKNGCRDGQGLQTVEKAERN